MQDNQAVVAAVEKYLLEGAAKIKAAMKGSSGDETEPSAEEKEKSKKELTSLLETQASKGRYCHTPSFAPRRQVAEPPSPSRKRPCH